MQKLLEEAIDLLFIKKGRGRSLSADQLDIFQAGYVDIPIRDQRDCR